MKYGYARVSTNDQDAAMQLAALKKDGCKKIFTDKGISGAASKAPALLRLLKVLKYGDSVTVWKLDRLGRTTRNLVILLDDLKQRGVKFKSLTQAIDTETPAGRAMWQLLAVFAEMEHSLIRERTKAGIADARGRGLFSKKLRRRLPDC